VSYYKYVIYNYTLFFHQTGILKENTIENRKKKQRTKKYTYQSSALHNIIFLFRGFIYIVAFRIINKFFVILETIFYDYVHIMFPHSAMKQF